MSNRLHRVKSRNSSGNSSRRRPDRPLEALEERCLFALAVTAVSPATSATSLINQILVPNTGITVTGGTFVSAPNQAGTYTGFDTSNAFTRLTISNGILLTTGRAVDAQGPNDSPATSTSIGSGGDTDLDVLVGQTTNDANSVTFTFTVTPGTNSILFDFIFGSDEYREFVGSPFNDAFAAYLDGTQISFDINRRPITVNNNFFRVDNTFNTLDVEYDGLTPRIRTQAPLNANNATHTLKFVTADTVDTAYDSGAFISRLQGSPKILNAPTTELPNPGVLSLNQASYQVSEGGGSATITVNRTQGTSGLVSADYTIVGTTATAGLDFIASSGTLLFQDGQTTQTLTIPILEDALVEGSEKLTITLSNPVDAGLVTPSSAELTIVDNENGVQYLDPTFSITEDALTATITVERFGDLSAPATVQYAASDGTAVAPLDYNATSGTLNFAPNETTKTFTIPVRNDFVTEPTETVNLALTNPTGGPALGQRANAVLNIVDYDRPPTLYNISSYAPRGKIEALWLTFNKDMVPERVVDLANYRVFLSNGGKPTGPNKRNIVAMRSAEYDVASKTVTLRPITPMKLNTFYEIAVRTRTSSGVRGANGEMLDGNVNGILDLPQFGGPNYSNVFDLGLSIPITGYLDSGPGEDFVGYFGRGNKLTYNDRNGDKVKIATAGGGEVEVVRTAERDARVVRVTNATPSSTILFGKVTPRRGSDLFTDVDELYINGQATNQLSSPSFRIGHIF
jgi:hypothetical protein